jgi:hypothetical protein
LLTICLEICCLSEVVYYGATFFSAVLKEIALTVRGLLIVFDANAPPVSDTLYVPNFGAARDDLRNALCRLACALTRILPVTIDCETLSGDLGYAPVDLRASISAVYIARSCANAGECSQSFLCRVADIFVGFVSILVVVLQTVREIVTGVPNPSDDLVNSAECLSLNDAIGCLTNVFVYILQQVRAACVCLCFAVLTLYGKVRVRRDRGRARARGAARLLHLRHYQGGERVGHVRGLYLYLYRCGHGPRRRHHGWYVTVHVCARVWERKVIMSACRYPARGHQAAHL